MATIDIRSDEVELVLNDMIRDVNTKLKGDDFMETSVQAAINKFAVNPSNDGRMWTYPNQNEDALAAVKRFVDNPNLRILSGMKKVKVGASGFIYRLLQYAVSSPRLWVNHANCFVVTGMSNKQWEIDMKKDAPEAIRDNIYHHGKLKKIEKKVKDMRNGLVVIDEIDTASKEWQLLHKILEPRLDLEDMRQRNNRFVFVSATMFTELKELMHWEGGVHDHMVLSIGSNYMGHAEFDALGMIQDSFSMNTVEDAAKWVELDILPYETDFRVHLVRVRNKKMVEALKQICRDHQIHYLDHNSTDRLSDKQLEELYTETSRTRHVVLTVKGLLRRADLIPNEWKMRVGAVHELYVNPRKVNPDVQIQGLPGRMCGYWKDMFDQGHRAGPFRCNKQAIIAYLSKYDDVQSDVEYNTNTKLTSMLVHTKNVKKAASATAPASPATRGEVVYTPEGFHFKINDQFVIGMNNYDTYEENSAFLKTIGGKSHKNKVSKEDPRYREGGEWIGKGPYMYQKIADWVMNYKESCDSNFPKKKSALKVGDYTKRSYICYLDPSDPDTIRYVTAYIQRTA